MLASDVQEYSRVLASALGAPIAIAPDSLIERALLELSEVPESVQHRIRQERAQLNDPEAWAEHLARHLECGSIAAAALLGDDHEVLELAADATHLVMFRYYGGVYFSYQQAATLDALRRAIREIEEPTRRDVALAALLGTASDLASSVGGHFAQPIRARAKDGTLKLPSLRQVQALRRRDAIQLFKRRLAQYGALTTPSHPVMTIRADFSHVLESLPSSIGTVYADPPYTREHYSRFYHVLETLAIGDDPGLSLVTQGGMRVASRGLYRVDRHQSPFGIVSKAPTAFASMFETIAAKSLGLVLSYSPVPENEKPRARTVALQTLVDLASEHFSDVRVLELEGIRHAKLNAAHLNAPQAELAEVLVIAQP